MFRLIDWFFFWYIPLTNSDCKQTIASNCIVDRVGESVSYVSVSNGEGIPRSVWLANQIGLLIVADGGGLRPWNRDAPSI